MQDSLLHYYEKVQPSKDGAQNSEIATPASSDDLPVSTTTASEFVSLPSIKSHAIGLVDPTNQRILSANDDLSEENRNLRFLLLQERQDRQQALHQTHMQNQHAMPFHITAQDELYYQRNGFSSPNYVSGDYPYPQQYHYTSRGREVRERKTWYHNCSIM